MAQTLIDNGQKIIIVDMENALASSDYLDDIHPLDSGKEKMAQLWFDKLKLLLPTPSMIQPNITSIPDTIAYQNLPYKYNVDADGVGAPLYSFTSPPSGMMINSKTGIIDWTPTSTGTFPVTVQAVNGIGSNEQSFTITVVPKPTLDIDLISYWNMDENNSDSKLIDLPGLMMENL